MSCSRDPLPVALLDVNIYDVLNICLEYKDAESPTVGENSAQYTNRSLIIRNVNSLRQIYLDLF